MAASPYQVKRSKNVQTERTGVAILAYRLVEEPLKPTQASH